MNQKIHTARAYLSFISMKGIPASPTLPRSQSIKGLAYSILQDFSESLPVSIYKYSSPEREGM